MNKHVLMLTVATVALMAGPAFAATTTITSKVTTQQKTSTTGDLTIGSGGSVVVTTAGPAVEIDSANWVSNSVSGTLISNKNTDNAIGVQLDGSTTGNGPGTGTIAFDNFGTVDLTGTGSSKTGILVTAPDTTGDIFNGDIKLEAGSSVTVKGDSSAGLSVASGATLNGTITILGQMLVNPTTTTSTTAGLVTGLNIAGDVNGNIAIGSGGSVQAIGYGAIGMTVTGAVSGSITNGGNLEVVGTVSPKTTGGNPEAGTALIVSNNVGGGILNGGPSPTGTSTTAASLGVKGVGPAVWISPGATASSPGTAMTIGTYTDADDPNFSFLNRGSISAASQDPNISEIGIYMVGGSAAPVTLTGGIFNSGTVTATATSDGKQASPYNATALSVGSYVNVNSGGAASAALVNSNETGSGAIKAIVSGSTGGTATAVAIGTNANLASLDNSGTISAAATTTDTTITSLAAYGINDLSGTLKTINNSGTISATATTLDNGNELTIAANLSTNTSGVNFTDSGTVLGDLKFGTGNDTLSVNGPAGGTAANVTGNIAFGGTNGGGYDALTIGTTGAGNVAGAVTEVGGGRVNVTIGGQGTLTLKNTATSLVANNLAVDDNGVLNISLSNGFNQQADPTNPALIVANNITFTQLAKLNVSFGSFVSTPGGNPAQFTLFDAANSINLTTPDTIKNDVTSSLPYLFQGTLCGYNVAGFTNDTPSACTDTPASEKLVLSLEPKTAAQVGLTGNAAKIFPYANAALATDDALGAAIVTDVTNQATAQAAYSSFLPDLSGSSRAVAIALTDPATGPVGARQRALRMYAAKPGGTTLWGQEFVERLDSGGNTDAFRGSGFGFVLGADSGDPRSGRYGGAFTFFSGDQTNKGPNFTKTTNEWYMLSGYTNWRGKGLFFDSQLSVGYGNLNGRRSLQLTDPTSGSVVFQRSAKSKRAGLLLAGGVTTGVVLTYGGTVLAPELSIDGLTMREEGYTESGGGSGTGTSADGFDLRVQPYYANSLRGYLGATVRQDVDLGGFYIQPSARVGYRYDFLANPVKLKMAFASMASTAGSTFTLTGPDPERGDLVTGASLAVTTGAWSLGLNYDYLRGSGGSVSQAGTLTLIGRI